MNAQIANAVSAIHVPAIQDSFVICTLKGRFPKTTTNSPKAKAAAVEAMLKEAQANGRDLTRADAEKKVSARVQLFPDGEIKAIKTPYYAFDTKMRRICGKWMGTNQHLLSVHKIDYLEQAYQDAQLAMYPLIEAFKRDYPKTLARLEQQGGFFDRADYPAPEIIGEYFRFDFTMFPIQDPSQFQVGGLTQDQVETLQKRLADSLQEQAAETTRQFARDLLKELNQLQSAERFHSSSLVTRLTDYVESNLNVIGDPDVTEALQHVRDTAAVVKGIADSGGSDDLKEEAKAKAKQAADKLAMFL